MRDAPGSVVCIGAGPAGLTAGMVLSREGAEVTVLEQDPIYVGGISRTVQHRGFCCDIGGHRFFSKSMEIERIWSEILEKDFLDRPRKSRIYYKNKLFSYPLTAGDALMKLGPFEAARCVLSYARARAMPAKTPRNFEEYVVNQFGRRLFEVFFKTYTEKVWGMKCSEISADWAAQRIKGLSLSSAIVNALWGKAGGKSRPQTIKTLIDSFRYPRKGPGMMWEAAAGKIREAGGRVQLGRRVEYLELRTASPRWLVVARDEVGQLHRYECDDVISSMPIKELAQCLNPAMSVKALAAAGGLRYRDFLIVALIVKDRGVFDDNWIYVHEPGVDVGRIQNFKSWSPEMVPDPALNCYGLEYFCFERDRLWGAGDAELIEKARRELIELGLADENDIMDGFVIRQPKAYPVYDGKYQEHVLTIRAELATRFPGLHLAGRNGMHKYNNQDHAMMTGLLSAKNILAGREIYDVWRVNQDAEYHETGTAGAENGLVERYVPRHYGATS